MYVLGISVLMWYNLRLSQAAVEHSPGVGREEHISDANSSQDAICTPQTWQEIEHCMRELRPLVANGFPWGLANISEIQNQIRHQQMQGDKIQDPLDPINHVCVVFDDFLKCLDQHSIPDECLPSGAADAFRIHVVFQFVCHMQPRSSDLLHSLH